MTFGSPLDGFLDPGENLLWSGQPKQGVRLQASDWFAIPFSIFWCGFVFVWEAMALGIGFGVHAQNAPRGAAWLAWIFPLWGVPFVVIGVYMLVGRFFVDAMRRTKTWYGITNRRLIIYKALFTSNVTSYDFETLTNLQLIERKDNSGDIVFGTPVVNDNLANSFGQRRRYAATPGFYLLPSARQIYNQIREVQKSARK
jgi:hypothetical protein